jgi:hypothetical protein
MMVRYCRLTVHFRGMLYAVCEGSMCDLVDIASCYARSPGYSLTFGGV